MPSSATITAYYSFYPNRSFKKTQAQNNFDVLRGHTIPIHPNTSTSSNNTYDLGSSEYYWRNAYINSVLNSTINLISNNYAFNYTNINTSFSYSLTEVTIAGSSISFTSSTISNYEISLAGNETTTSRIAWQITGTLTAAATGFQTYEFKLYRTSVVSGLTSTSMVGRSSHRSYYSNNPVIFNLNQDCFKFIDSSVSSGNHKYFYTYKLIDGTQTTTCGIYITDMLMYAREF